MSVEVLINKETNHGTLTTLLTPSDQYSSLHLHQLLQVLSVYHSHLLGLDDVATHYQTFPWLFLYDAQLIKSNIGEFFRSEETCHAQEFIVVLVLASQVVCTLNHFVQ